MALYKIGTATFTNASNIITGSGTLWLTNVAVGDSIKKTGENAIYSIASVNSNTQVTISVNYAGTTASGVAYTIGRDATTNHGFYETDASDPDLPFRITESLRQIDSIITNLIVVNKTADFTVLSNETGYVYTNAGATATITGTLPTPAAGLHYIFKHNVLASIAAAGTPITIRIKPATGHMIYYGNQLIVNPGYLELSKIGISVKITAINSTTWQVDSLTGIDNPLRNSIGQEREYKLVGANVWTTKATGGTARSGLTGFSLNGYGYICNGESGGVSNEVNQYNDSANVWTTKATGGTARSGLAGFSLNGYGYICNGYIGGFSNEVNQYNDSANVWTTKATGGTARYYLTGFSLNGYGYICNGYIGAAFNEVNQYNDSANVWTTKATGGTARFNSAGFSLNGYGYICNGYTEGFFNEVNQYNDSANVWTTKATGGTARNGLTGFSLNGYGYICNGESGGVSNEVNQYNDSANVWTTKATGGTARYYLTGFSLNGYGYICNGYIGAVSNEVNQYN